MNIRFMWEEIIRDLIAAGLSEGEIATRIGTSQPTINRIKLGRRKRVEHEIGEALLALQRTMKRKQPRPNA